MELISKTFIGDGIMPNGVPFVVVFLEDWNRDPFDDMVDVLDARISKWGSIFPYGLTTLFPYSCLATFKDSGDFDGEIFGTELAKFGDHVLFVGLGLLLTCFTFRVSFFCLRCLISPTPHPTHMSQFRCKHSNQSYDQVPVFASTCHYLQSSKTKTF